MTERDAMNVDEALLLADSISADQLGGKGALSALVLLAAEVRRQHAEVESLRVQLAHWRVFGAHAEGERSRLQLEVQALRVNASMSGPQRPAQEVEDGTE